MFSMEEKETMERREDDTYVKRQKLEHCKESTSILQKGQQQQLRSPEWHYHPLSFVTWNCNGFSTRAKYNRDDLKRLIDSTGGKGEGPDLICIQEARLKAEGPGERRCRPLRDNDSAVVEKALRDVFRGYIPFWSLADKKYSGTLTLIRKTCFDRSGCGNNDDDFVAFTFRSAIDLMLRRFDLTRKECGLPEVLDEEEDSFAKPTGGTPNKKQQQQTSLKSFFAPKAKPKGSATKVKKTKRPHHPEGRFQFFFFPGMDIFQTYVPNNGGKEESFQRRRTWDASMKQFLMDRKKILAIASKTRNNLTKNIDSSKGRKLLWCGDMNATLSFRDGSHWERTKGSDDAEVYEWWRDTKKCFSKFSELAKNPPRDPEHQGIPGFTPAERKRFRELIKVGDFCDLWREQHPTGVCDESDESRWEKANFTWRGTQAKTPGGFAKYQGRGQRLDYFLLSPRKIGRDALQSSSRHESDEEGFSPACDFHADCHIRGYGTKMEGLFCGSDHCAVELILCRSAVP